jgi:hypothetical protein
MRNGGGIMKTMCLGQTALVACCLLAGITTASAGTCTATTFDTYFASAFSCTIGDLEFSNFTAFGDSVTGGAVAIPSSSITITPSGSDATSLDLALSFSSTSPFSVNSNQTSTLSFDYTVTPLAGYELIPSSPYFTFYSYNYAGTGSVSVNPNESGPIPGTAPVSQSDIIELSGGTSGNIDLTSSTDYWYVEPTATPVPAALPLFGTGLSVMGLLGWRRKRKSAAIAAA